jgi:hypothetical protein
MLDVERSFPAGGFSLEPYRNWVRICEAHGRSVQQYGNVNDAGSLAIPDLISESIRSRKSMCSCSRELLLNRSMTRVVLTTW